MGKKICFRKILFLSILFVCSYIAGGILLKYPDVRIVTEEVTHDDILYNPQNISEKLDGKININAASAQTLQELDGIGEKLSERIIEYRTHNGAFDTIESIMDVPGLGYEKFKDIEDFICAEVVQAVGSETVQAVNAEEYVATEAPKSGDKININTATAAQLQQLDGIGEKISQRIVDYRNKYGAFNSIEEIKNVSGIGDKRFETIRNNICVGE